MNKLERRAFEHFLPLYKRQWDQNQYNRTNYDEDLEYYLGFRNQYKYPFAYNESFNKILPTIMTVMSRFMDQLYQSDNLISVRARTRNDVERKNIVEGLLNYQMETMNDIDMQGGSYLTMFKWLFNALAFGKGIVKGYWKKEERIMPRRVALPVPQFDDMGRIVGMETIDHLSMEMQTLYDQPYLEVLHNKLFVPDPSYKNIQQMPAVYCVYKRSMDYIKRMADKGVYRNIKEIPWHGAGGTSGAGVTGYGSDSAEAFAKSLDIEGALEIQHLESQDSKSMAPLIDIIEGYGKFIFDTAPYEIGSGIKIKGKEEEAIIHIANYKTVIKIEKNQYHNRPFFDIGAYIQPEMFWDVGITRLCKGIQEQYNNLANLRMQNASMLVNQMLKVREDSDIDPASLVWKPFGLIPVEEMNDVEPLIIPDVGQTQVFREQEQFFDATIQDMTGVYDFMKGTTPRRQERVGVVYSLQSVGEARTKLLLMTMDHMGIRPLLKYMMILNTYHLPHGAEYRFTDKEGDNFGQVFAGDIHPDFDFSARYTSMEPALGKQFRAQQLLQLAQIWQQDPTLQHYQWKKSILEMLDYQDSDRYLKTPEQLMKEQQQAVQMQMMAAAQETQSEMRVEQLKGNLDIQKEVVKGLMK